MSGFFIDRIRFAIVVSLVISIVGALALTLLPVQQYPDISPPTVNVSATYPGADAETIANVVAGPIETAINGVDDMLYMSSNSSNAGLYSLSITFAVGTDTDIAQVNVQNAVQRATAQLPSAVTQQGVTVGSSSPDFILAVALVSPDDSLDRLEIANYATTRVVDPIVRIDGVGDASVTGAAEYSMRIWLDGDRMRALEISPQDVMAAIRSQNTQASLGTVAGAPSPEGVEDQYTIVAEGRMTDESQFEDIIVRRGDDGALTRLSDIARVELGSQSYAASAQVGGQDAAMIQINQSPGANALATREAVIEELDELAKAFPAGLEYQIIYDATLFVSSSVDLILDILLEAFVIVMAIVFLFLGDWRATVVAGVAIPVSLLGAMAALLLMGYSLNTISLLALVLAIGLVVDDAILVVENVQHVMEEDEDISLKDAARKAMKQITGPIVSTTFVLLAVVTPTAFLPGINGQLYRQFAVTVGSSLTISAFVAVTLSPALAAALMKRPKKGDSKKGIMGRIGAGIDWVRDHYGSFIGGMLKVWYIPLAGLAACFAVAGWLFMTLPSTFLPDEDQGALFVNIQLPDAASLTRTEEIVSQVTNTVADTPGVNKAISVAGFSILQGTVSPNGGMVIASLKPWDERTDDDQQLQAMIGKLNQQFAAIPGAVIGVFAPPSIPGIGAVGGLDLRLQALAGQSPEELAEVLQSFITKANQSPAIGGLRTTFSASVPLVRVEVDRTRAERLGLSVADIYDVIGANFGSSYVNDFIKGGRVFQVNIQADADFRATADDILRLEARNKDGQMVPLSTVVTVTDDLGPYILQRYNLYTAAQINGQPAEGGSSGAAMGAVSQVAADVLPDGYDFAWAGLSFQQTQSSGSEIVIFGMALLFAYLFLVALYESWMLPVSIILSLGAAAFGAMVALWAVGMPTSLYVQIALVLLIGLAAKNAILIVEFAKDRSDEGQTPIEAARNGAEARFRAVLMTSLAFIFGLLPLAKSSGAGAGAQNAVGVTVIGGMLGVTLIGLFVIPALYYAIQSMREWFHGTNRKGGGDDADGKDTVRDEGKPQGT
ncbi:efflux RND transporter permease subunit [Roseovarius sp. Pro17]|uniref:efflux RND transporter permease subunit n=1 Tax=Roseovarius sp. Pro17 TaxID=3108175 RepID=UPI002D77744B|nr:efflux RND transporter permease subunit [Roseovarius sp. Pro17]